MTTEKNQAQERARAQFESVAAMVAALECDYDRLEELREERANLVEEIEEAEEGETEDPSPTRTNEAMEALSTWDAENGQELAELELLAGDCESEEEARQRIEEDALSVEVRSGWASLGEPLTADEFCILLCTGGPAARIRGELSGGEPHRAWLEYQDWGTPWTEFVGADQAVLLTYARCFYFGS